MIVQEHQIEELKYRNHRFRRNLWLENSSRGQTFSINPEGQSQHTFNPQMCFELLFSLYRQALARRRSTIHRVISSTLAEGVVAGSVGPEGSMSLGVPGNQTADLLNAQHKQRRASIMASLGAAEANGDLDRGRRQSRVSRVSLSQRYVSKSDFAKPWVFFL